MITGELQGIAAGFVDIALTHKIAVKTGSSAGIEDVAGIHHNAAGRCQCGICKVHTIQDRNITTLCCADIRRPLPCIHHAHIIQGDGLCLYKSICTTHLGHISIRAAGSIAGYDNAAAHEAGVLHRGSHVPLSGCDTYCTTCLKRRAVNEIATGHIDITLLSDNADF